MRLIPSAIIRPVVCAMLLIAASPKALATDPITFYLEDEPVYTSSSQETPGFLMEIVLKMADTMNLKPKIRFLPWKRAQFLAMRTPNAMIFPLTRTSLREHHYRWICKLFDVPVMFINKVGTRKIDTPEQAKKVRGIGVIIGTPQEERLKAFGIPYVAMPGDQLYAALEQNRVSAIYTAKPEAILGWREAGYREPLQFGQTQQELSLWIAANPDSPAVNTADWQEALAKIKQSGYYNAILHKYFGTEAALLRPHHGVTDELSAIKRSKSATGSGRENKYP